MRKLLVTVAALGVIAWSAAAWAVVQETSFVLTENGKEIPNATVTLTLKDASGKPTTDQVTTKTDAQGKATVKIEDKNVQTVDITVRKPRGRTQTKRDVPLDVFLRGGEIEVAGPAPSPDTTTTFESPRSTRTRRVPSPVTRSRPAISAAGVNRFAGAFMGIEGGAAWTNAQFTTTGTQALGIPDPVLAPSSDAKNTGGGGGVFIGYAIPLASSWIARIQAGGGYRGNSRTISGIPGTAGVSGATPAIQSHVQSNGGTTVNPIIQTSGTTINSIIQSNDSTTIESTWDAYVLGHAGILVTPSTQIFLSGGVSWLRIQASINCTLAGVCGAVGMPVTATNSTTRAGSVLGGGIETVLAAGWSGRIEYRHANYGSYNALYGNPATLAVAMGARLTTDTVMFGLSYALGAR